MYFFHKDVQQLIHDFLVYKKLYGSVIEKELYNDMSYHHFIIRLLCKRPYMFINKNDTYLLRDGTSGFGGFEKIGTKQQANIQLRDYLSYDEMMLSALLNLSGPVTFINNGNRYNRGKQTSWGSYEPHGILTALVGPRFEKIGYMEHRYMIVTKENLAQQKKDPIAILWQKYYDISPNLTMHHVKNDTTQRYYYLHDGCYFDTHAYKKD